MVCVCAVEEVEGELVGEMVQSYPLKADGSPSNLDKPCTINVSLNNMEVTSCIDY